MSLNPPTEAQLLVFWVALLVIVASARLLGALMQRVGQPAVVGELAAGLLLGPSVLGAVAPDVTDWLFPDDDAQTAMLFTVGWIGVLLLLVSTGFETDLGLIARLGRAATLVSAGSLIVPAVAGFAVGWFIPVAFVGGGTERYIFALFIAAALSISSLPVIAKILSEMGLMRRNFGQLTLAAGMANDVIGWIALGFIAGLAQAGGVKFDKLAFTLIGVTVFFVAAFTVGQRAVDASLRRVRARGNDPLAGLSVILITALTFGVITQWLHVEAVLGAFIAGVILARSRFADHALIQPVETVTAAIFAPVFFATAGLRVDLGLLADAETLVWAAIVLAAASASKFAGSLLGARLSNLPTREGAALGVGLNARGALEIVIATVGLQLGVLNDRSYTVIVLMAMATSMAAPPLLRRTLRNWSGTPEERLRLDRENQLASNQLVTGGRLLVPSQGGPTSLLATQVAAMAWPDGTDVTVLDIGTDPVDPTPFDNVLADHTVVHQRVEADDIVRAVVDEARLGYDAIVVGTTWSPEAVGDAPGSTGSTNGAAGGRATMLPPQIVELIRASPIPVVVVRPPVASTRLPWAFSRAVVAINGARSSRPAQELAAYISAAIGTRLHYLHVTPTPSTPLETILGDHAPHTTPARNIIDDAAAIADTVGANFVGVIEHNTNPAAQIIASTDELGADLLIISGTSRTTRDELFVGHTIEHVLGAATDTTLLVALAPEPTPAVPAAAPAPEAEPAPAAVPSAPGAATGSADLTNG